MSKKNRVLAKAVILSGLLIATSQASAITILPNDTSLTENIPGVTTFQTHGDDMNGLRVTATFTNGSFETEIWGTTGVGSGGVTGTGWGLNLTGDTFSADWNFSNGTGVALKSLVLDASHATGGGFVVFDRTTSGVEGTANSAQGRDVVSAALGEATYSVQVGVDSDGPGPQPAELPVGDLWHVLSMDFGNGLDLRSWTFKQDTDNDLRHEIPEPASIAMMMLGFVGLGFMRRRSRC